MTSEYIPYSMTLVYYMEGDIIGYLLAGISLAPIYIVVSYVSILWALRFPIDLVLVFIGQLTNVGLCMIIKRIWKQPRPQGIPHITHLGVYGMPSNHSQFMAFMAISAMLLLNKQSIAAQSIITKPIVLFLWILWPLVAISRVYLEYHTTEQVLVGCVIGGIVAIVWSQIVPIAFQIYKNIFQTEYLTWKILYIDLPKYLSTFFIKSKTK